MTRRTMGASALVLALFAGPALAQTVTPAPAKDAKPVVVPFELLRTKHMAVTIKVNGKGPYRVIFDTGAPMTVLTNKVAREAGLLQGAAKPSLNLFGASGGPVTAKTLEVGGLKAENVQVIVMDHPTVKELALALGPIEGIVGFPFFARYRMTLDYKEKKMTFVPSGFEPPDVFQAMMNEVSALTTRTGAKAAPKILSPAAQWGFVPGKEKDDDDPGVTVKDVLPGGAAAAAGLRAGDRLLMLDDRWTDSVADLFLAAGFVKPGGPVKVVIKRDKKDVTLTVTPRAGL